jgi:hypothetical protein
MGLAMDRRQRWQQALDTEIQRWSAMPYQELIAALPDIKVYEVERDGEKYQVEVSLLENTERYLHVAITVDDGSLPASIVPACQSFRREKPLSSS